MRQLIAQKKAIFLFLIGGAFLSACTSVTVSPNSIQAVPTCISPTPQSNIYLYPPKVTNVSSIFYEGQHDITNARKRALFYLGEHIAHSSDYVDIVTDDGHIVRITVVYIRPYSVQFVFLNHAFYSNNMYIYNFEEELNNRLLKLGNRDEMIFFVIFSLPEYNKTIRDSASLVLDFPIEQMVLRNSGDVAVLSTHDDHILDELIPISRRPVSGYVAFPFSLMIGETCHWIMDPKWNTTMTLDIDRVSINGINYGTKYWSVQYSPLVYPLTSSIPFTKEMEAINRINLENMVPLEEPPIIEVDETKTQQDSCWDNYWQEKGRYIWYRMILENYP